MSTVLKPLQFRRQAVLQEVKPLRDPHPLVSRQSKSTDSVVKIGRATFGGGYFSVIAGPCAVESLQQMEQTAADVMKSGASCLRGGAFKPRTSPYSFQGLGHEGLQILSKVSRSRSISTVTEIVDVADIQPVQDHADALQVGARNMQNFRLLKELGKCKKPVILKRGMAAKVEDLLLAAEYILAEGNPNVILCERGIRTFETATRNTLDLNAIPYIKSKSHLPVIVDPSHGTGVREFVAPMALAAAACGADGLIIEVHHDPAVALSDGAQSLFPEQFDTLMSDLKPIVAAVGKELVCN